MFYFSTNTWRGTISLHNIHYITFHCIWWRFPETFSEFCNKQHFRPNNIRTFDPPRILWKICFVPSKRDIRARSFLFRNIVLFDSYKFILCPYPPPLSSLPMIKKSHRFNGISKFRLNHQQRYLERIRSRER